MIVVGKEDGMWEGGGGVLRGLEAWGVLGGGFWRREGCGMWVKGEGGEPVRAGRGGGLWEGELVVVRLLYLIINCIVLRGGGEREEPSRAQSELARWGERDDGKGKMRRRGEPHKIRAFEGGGG